MAKVKTTDLEHVDPATLVAWERNPRVNDHAVAAVAGSIKRFGFGAPVVARPSDRRVLAGHTRIKAAVFLGLATVPVRWLELADGEADAYALADNRLAELAQWDDAGLAKILGEVENPGDLGWTGDDLAKAMGRETAGLTDPDAVPEPPDNPITQRGDIWVLGEHRLMCGDSSSPEDVDRLLDGEKIQLVNTDPPYNVRVEPRSNNAIAAGLSSFAAPEGHHQKFDLERHPEKAQPTSRKLRPKDRPLENDFVSDAEFDRLLHAWFGNIARVLEPGRAFYIWGGYANCGNYPPVLKECELYFAQAVIWVKEHPVLTRKDFMGNHEWCFYGWREGAAHWFNPEIHNATDVWREREQKAKAARKGAKRAVVVEVSEELLEQIPSDVWSVKKVNPQSMVHLTEKPVELAVRAMTYSSRPGENVLDLFGGSGSTLIAAERTGRRAHLMEIDQLYCDVIVKRWEEYSGRKAERIGRL